MSGIDDLRAQVAQKRVLMHYEAMSARLEKLADEWERIDRGPTMPGVRRQERLRCAGELRAALRDPS